MTSKQLFFFLSLVVFSLFVIPNSQNAFATVPTYQATVTDTTSIEGVTSCTMDVNVQATTDMIVVGFVSDVAINTISDEDAQTYTQRASWTTSHFSYLYTTTSPTTNAANTITITTSSSADMRCFAITLAGVNTSTPIGNTGSNGGASSPASDTITFSTANTDSIIIHVCGNEWSDDETWDTGKVETGQITDGGANKFSGAIAYETMTGSGSNDATCAGMSTGKAWSHAVIEVRSPSAPIYVVDLLDVYESSSTTLGSGTAVCVDVDLETADDCNGLQTASFVDSKNINTQNSVNVGLDWSPDGTKMFFVGDSVGGDGEVNEFTCTSFDVSTCSVVDALDITGQEVSPRGLAFSPDGTKMFVAGSAGVDVNEYTCSAFDVSTCVFVDSFSVSAQITTAYGLDFSTDGTKMFVIDQSTPDVNEYTCSAFDVSTCVFVDSFSVSTNVTTPTGMAWSNDGLRLFINDDSDDTVNEYTCNAFDVSTCVFVDSFSVSAQDTAVRGLAFSTDGTKMFVGGDVDNDINEYTLNAPLKIGSTYRFEVEVDNTGAVSGSPTRLDADSVVAAGDVFGSIAVGALLNSGCSTNTDWTEAISSTEAQFSSGTTCSISASGLVEFWFIVTIDPDAADGTTTFSITDGTVSDVSTTTSFDVTTPVFAFQELDVYESASTTLDSGTAICANTAFYDGYCTGWNPETFSYASSDLALTSANGVTDMVWNNDGTKLFTVNFSTPNVSEYSCTAWDASTCSFTDNTSFSADETELRGITWNGDGTKLYLVGSVGDDINEYNCTAFDVSTCTTASSVLSISTQDGTPQAIHWNNDGTKFFMLGFDGLDVNEYGSCTAYDVSTCSFVDSKSVNQDTLVAGLDFSPDGTRMFVSGRTSDEVNEYRCKAWDVSTCSYVQTVSITATSTSPQGLTFSADGTRMYTADDTGDDIIEYSLTSLTASSTYRFEVDVINLGGVTTSPDVFSMLSSVGSTQTLGSITATDITSSGCSTNTNWTDSIVATTNVQLDAGTTCSLAPGGTATYWFIVTVGDTAPRTDTSTFKVDDGSTNNTSSLMNFSIKSSGTTNYTKNIVDNLSVIDQQDFAILLNFADPMSITDSVTTSHGRTSTKSDPISITDSVATFITRYDTESDPISFTDSVTEIIMRFDAESDPLSITDSVTTVTTRFDAESDPLSITDSITATVVILNTESDPLSITDSVTTVTTRFDAESDPLSITDSVTTVTTRFDAESDPLSITDSVTATRTVLDSESDPLSITDSVTTLITRFDSESDPLSITDNVTTVTTRFDAESDPLSITDSMTTLLTRYDAESDPLSITDSVTTVTTRFDAESDPLSITDSVTDTVARINTESDQLSITDNMTPICTGCGAYTDSESDPVSITDSVATVTTRFDTESDPLSITDSMTPLIVRNISFTEGVDVGDDGAGNPDVTVDKFDTESDPVSILDSLTTIVGRFFNNADQLSITDSMTATNGTGIHYINVTEAVNVLDIQDTALFFYEPTGKVIWFKVADPTNSTKGGVYSYMCDSTEIVTGINGTGYVKCTTLYAPTNSTRGGVYQQSCGGSEYVSGIDGNGNLICTALP